MKYLEFVEKFDLKGKKSPIFKNEGKCAFTKVNDEIVLIFGDSVVSKEEDEVGVIKGSNLKNETINKITETAYIIGGATPKGEMIW